MADKGMPSVQNWRTPPSLFGALNQEFRFVLDVAADERNKWCPRAFSEHHSALDHSWGLPGDWGFCNPPYNNVAPFLDKAVEQLQLGVGSVFLIPANVEARYWERTVWRHAAEVRLITGRVAFCHPTTGAPIKGNRYNSSIVVFRPYWPGKVPHVYRIDHFWENTAPVVPRMPVMPRS